VAEVTIPINAPGSPLQLYRNAHESGWMRAQDWDYWWQLMNGDGDDRDKGRRHKPAWNAWAAALITQSPPDEAEAIAAKVFREAHREWSRKHDFFGRISYQFQEHLVAQHWLGTIALYFVPVLGPFLSGIASSMTPMIEAAQKTAIAKREAQTVSQRFRGEYYAAMDAWLKGGPAPPMEFMEYHASVIIPAAHEVRDQIKAGKVQTATGVYSLDTSGFEIWAQQGEDWAIPSAGPLAYLQNLRVSFAMQIRRSPRRVLLSLLVGALSGTAAFLFLRRA
jgi:hypothetical protein